MVSANTGTQILSNVSVTDALNGAYPKFGTYTPSGALNGQYKIITLPSVSGAAGMSANLSILDLALRSLLVAVWELARAQQ